MSFLLKNLQLPRLVSIMETNPKGKIDEDIMVLRRHSAVLKCRRLLQNRRIAGLFLQRVVELKNRFQDMKDEGMVDLLFWRS